MVLQQPSVPAPSVPARALQRQLTTLAVGPKINIKYSVSPKQQDELEEIQAILDPTQRIARLQEFVTRMEGKTAEREKNIISFRNRGSHLGLKNAGNLIPAVHSGMNGDVEFGDFTSRDLLRVLLTACEASKVCGVVEGDLSLKIDGRDVTEVHYTALSAASNRYRYGQGHQSEETGPEYALAELEVLRAKGYMQAAMSVGLGGAVAHATVALIDFSKNSIEYFEPHGWADWSDSVLEVLRQIFEPAGYTVSAPGMTCPKRMGPQNLADKADGGWCKTWSALYILERVLNPTADPVDIMHHLVRGTDADIQLRMRRIFAWASKHQENLHSVTKADIQRSNARLAELKKRLAEMTASPSS